MIDRILFVMWFLALVCYAVDHNFGAVLGFGNAIMYLMYRNNLNVKP